MPISLRKFHTPKAQQLADRIMKLAQHYGSDIENISMDQINQNQNSIKKRKFQEKKDEKENEAF